MIWLTWRQHRYEVFIAALLLVLLVVTLISTGLDVASILQSPGQEFNLNYYRPIPLTVIDMLPVILGVFVGAPLIARELEQGTYRLIWTQSVVPFQWLKVKLLLLGGALLPASGILFLIFIWWSQPVNEVHGPWQTFDYQGPVILAYTLFGLAVGIAFGAVLEKMLPSMAITVPVYLIVRFGVTWLRTQFLPPLSSIWDFTGINPQFKDWILSEQFVDQTGNPLFGSATQFASGVRIPLPNICSEAMALSQEAGYACLHDHGIRLRQVFQPIDRFWLFQGIETALFLALTAGLIALTFWWIKRQIVN